MMSNELILPCDPGTVSDGYHTFNELYEHRNLLWINILNLKPEMAFKTRKNDKGEVWEGWFIAGMNTPFGQLTYHLPEKHWNILDISEVESNSDYDQHTSHDVLERLELITVESTIPY